MNKARAGIERNLAQVREAIARAAERGGRTAAEITLVTVTKFQPAALVEAIVAAGSYDLGESRPQDLWSRAAVDLPGVRWHLIGHLQRNKVRRTLPLVHVVHSVDSERLLAAIDEEAKRAGLTSRVLLEANVSGEAHKHGFSAEELDRLAERLSEFSSVRVQGLMGMAPLEGGETAARLAFASLRQLRDRLSRIVPDGVSLAELSMGMSGDFEAAIEEGATMVRVGSALFEGIES